MNYGDIKYPDIANGPGVRVSLFVSGCTHHCKGCFQPETWDFDYGQPFDQEAEDLIFRYLDSPYVAGLSLLGGEPFEPENCQVLADFVQRVKDLFPDKTVWAYSGYLFEELLQRPDSCGLLALVDILVDGEFVEEEKDITLVFRGSANQRLIDVKRALLV